ncbi:porin family protein [Niabella terrae]
MKKYILISTVLFSTWMVRAQTRWGIEAGPVLSQVTIDGDEEFTDLVGDRKFRTGFKAGVFAEVPLSTNFYLSPSLHYVYKGGRYENKISNASGSGVISFTSNTHYLEVPVNFLYKPQPRGGFFVGAGPTVGMGLGGKALLKAEGRDSEGHPINESEENDIAFDGKTEADISETDDRLHLKRFEFGLNAFAGYELNNGLRFQLQYRPNFNDLSPESEGNYKNTYFGLGIGYLF